MTFSATSTYLISQYSGKIDHSEILFEKENAQLAVALAKSYKRVITNRPKPGKILKTNVLKQEKLREKKQQAMSLLNRNCLNSVGRDPPSWTGQIDRTAQTGEIKTQPEGVQMHACCKNILLSFENLSDVPSNSSSHPPKLCSHRARVIRLFLNKARLMKGRPDPHHLLPEQITNQFH